MGKINQFMHKVMHSKKIFYQLVIFTVAVSVLPLGLFIFMMNRQTNILIEDELINSYKQMQAQYTSGIEYKLRLYKDSLTKVARNTVIIDTLSELGRDGEQNSYITGTRISKEVGNFLSIETHDELKNCMIYSTVIDAPVYGKKVTTIAMAEKEIWYQYYEGQQDISFFLNEQSQVLSLLEKIVYEDVRQLSVIQLGFVKLDVDAAGFFSPASVRDAKDHYYDVVISDANGKLIYSSDAEYAALFDEPEEAHNFNADRSEIVYNKNSISLYSELEEEEMTIYFFFDTSQLNVRKADLQKTVLPFILLIFILIVVVAYFFSRSFTDRINILVNKMQKAQEGDLRVTEYIRGKDEINKLDTHFNQMLFKLDKMIHENYIQKLEKRETQLRHLRLQINPHFLYNTLETISSIAIIHKVYGIADISEKLGEMFRYSLGKDQKEYVPLSQELHHTQNYIYIQQQRFKDKFEVFYHVEKGMERMLILRFILQPVVENAIVHGLISQKGGSTLEISAYMEADRVVLKVEDDGAGMTEEEVAALKEHINNSEEDGRDKKRSGIGVKNVNQRIKMVCGNEYGIEISSRPGVGSCFLLYLPHMYI